MPMPSMDSSSLKKPVCYDPERKKFIYIDEIESGKEMIIPVDSLSEQDFKKLVIARLRASPPDITVQAISGPPFSRDDIIRAIERDEPFGKMTLEGDRSYLRDFLNKLQQKPKQP